MVLVAVFAAALPLRVAEVAPTLVAAAVSAIGKVDVLKLKTLPEIVPREFSAIAWK